MVAKTREDNRLIVEQIKKAEQKTREAVAKREVLSELNDRQAAELHEFRDYKKKAQFQLQKWKEYKEKSVSPLIKDEFDALIEDTRNLKQKIVEQRSQIEKLKLYNKKLAKMLKPGDPDYHKNPYQINITDAEGNEKRRQEKIASDMKYFSDRPTKQYADNIYDIE